METFEGYRDAQPIGEGGLGRVYRAVRESTNGFVAIKALRDVQDSSPAWHRANRELEAMLRVKGHPYVVTVEEIFLGPTGPCLVMEYLPGGSIADRMAAGPLPAPEVVLIGQHVTDALIAAHDEGIVHRDIKPANLMIGGFGQIKVGDFGISALVRGDEQTKTSSLTLAYASPEELDGTLPVGPPTDVYSLAATLHHLISGMRPSFSSRVQGWAPLDRSGDPAMAPLLDAIESGLQDAIVDRPTMAQFSAACDAAASLLGPRAIKRLDADTTVARGQTHVPPTPAPAPATAVGTPGGSTEGGGSRRTLAIGAAVAVAAAVIVGAVVLGGGDASGPEVPSASPSVAVSTAPTGSSAPAPVIPDPVPVTEVPTGTEAAAPSTEPEPEPTPVLDSVDGVLRFSGLFPTDGDMAAVAIAPRIGAALAIADINEAGGVLGVPVELNDAETVDAIVEADTDALADVVIGPIENDGTTTVLDTLRASGRLMISPSVTADSFAGDLFARMVGSNSTQGRAIGVLMQEAGAVTVGLVGLESPGPISILDAAATSAPLDVIVRRTYDQDDQSAIEATAAELIAASPDAVLIAGFDTDTAALITAIAVANDGVIPFRLFGTDANTGGSLVDLVGSTELVSGMVGTFLAAPIDPDFEARVLAAGDVPDTTFAAEAYDAVTLAALAALANDSDDPVSIAAQLVEASAGGTPCLSFAECAAILNQSGDIDYQGRSGNADLTVDLERVTASVVVFAYDGAGSFEFERIIEQG